MDNFLKYFYQDIGRVFHAFVEIIVAFFNFMNYLLNFPMRYKILREYSPNFTIGEWIMVLITEIILLTLSGILIWLVIKLLRKLLRFR